MLDAVTMLPFSATSGIANVQGDINVYSNQRCSCCKVNSFASPEYGGAGDLKLSCHNASAWPFGSGGG